MLSAPRHIFIFLDGLRDEERMPPPHARLRCVNCTPRLHAISFTGTPAGFVTTSEHDEPWWAPQYRTHGYTIPGTTPPNTIWWKKLEMPSTHSRWLPLMPHIGLLIEMPCGCTSRHIHQRCVAARPCRGFFVDAAIRLLVTDRHFVSEYASRNSVWLDILTRWYWEAIYSVSMEFSAWRYSRISTLRWRCKYFHAQLRQDAYYIVFLTISAFSHCLLLTPASSFKASFQAMATYG